MQPKLHKYKQKYDDGYKSVTSKDNSTLRYMENLYRKTRTMNLHQFCSNESRLKKND